MFLIQHKWKNMNDVQLYIKPQTFVLIYAWRIKE